MAYNRFTLEEKLTTKAAWLGECLVWSGQKDARGYGFLRLEGRLQRAHRLMYELHNGPIPAGEMVRHRCDNTSCIAPLHLVLGQQRENVRDMWERGRAKVLTGAANGRAKLTEAQVAEIRQRFRHHDRIDGGMVLAREFGISYTAMKTILAGRSYKPCA